ncbi:MAG: hypothetical protein KDK91_05820 [Gammaproteobacteria bacterium]|nr:hypothetical protein [Gammaproteobacteria bacterium]
MSNEELSQINERLFEAFRVDHATLGRHLHELAVSLRVADMGGARVHARRIDRECGAHIVFEEIDFYPALERFLEPEEVQSLYRDHASALRVIEGLCYARDEAQLQALDRRELLHRVEAMQVHVAECGELFGVMGGLSTDEKRSQLMKLQQWRERAPAWREVAALRQAAGDRC